MSHEFNKILHKMSLKNRKILEPILIFSLCLGINVKYEAGFKYTLKFVSLALFSISLFNIYTQYRYIYEHRFLAFAAYSDAICTTFQIWISLSILLHFSLTQQKFQKLVVKVQNTELLQNFELLDLNILNKKQIIQEIHSILSDSWLDIKRQVNFYAISITCVAIWYYSRCLVINLYNTFFGSSDFVVLYPLPSSFPFWGDKGFCFPYYMVHYIISASGTHVAGCAAIALTCLFITNIVHALGLLRILRRIIEYSSSENVLPEERVKYILAWTKFYQRIYEFYNEINSLYYIQSAPLFLITMLVICLLIFQGSVGLRTDANMVLEMIFFLCAVVPQIFLFCINGQRLTTECEQLSMAIYNTTWYEESNEFKLITRMMIMRTNRIFVMEVGGFTTMSRITFLAIMRSSFSFFLLLCEMNEQ